jgi:tetratricopeptide (TPR) repeat protein
MNIEKGLFVDVVYRQFVQIERDSYAEIIAFFEENKRQIQYLEEEAYAEIFYYYAKSLFETGAYAEFLACADHIVEFIIDCNIFEIRGENAYMELLFDKAAALYHLGEDGPAYKILLELLKMDPHNQYVRFFLKKLHRRGFATFRQILRSVSIVSLLSSAFIIFLEILFVESFFQDWLFQVEWTRSFLFVFALVLLGSGELYTLLSAHLSVNRLVSGFQKKKRTI